jgi:hypothetical protein
VTDRCEECNYKRGHAPTCKQATSADRLAAFHLPSHEEVQHHAAHGDGDVCGPASPPCEACGTVHHFGECPVNYVGPSLRERVKSGEQVLATIHTGPGADVRALADAMVFGTGIAFHLPTDPQARKDIPLASGCLDYFPDALAAVAATSLAGSRQHHPDEPLHWDRSKSGDEADALLRHLIQRGTIDTDGIRHSAKVAWRALALLQKEIEDAAGHGAGSSKAA